jgi:hypothetical protein
MAEIDIEGIDKISLLEELWNKSPVASFYTLNKILPPKFDKDKASKDVHEYIDYFCGRVIKSNLSGNYVNPQGYDRDVGEGMFAKIVSELKNKKNNNLRGVTPPLFGQNIKLRKTNNGCDTPPNEDSD